MPLAPLYVSHIAYELFQAGYWFRLEGDRLYVTARRPDVAPLSPTWPRGSGPRRPRSSPPCDRSPGMPRTGRGTSTPVVPSECLTLEDPDHEHPERSERRPRVPSKICMHGHRQPGSARHEPGIVPAGDASEVTALASEMAAAYKRMATFYRDQMELPARTLICGHAGPM